MDIYFYHPDHLGSTSIITNSYGEITQNISYIPYGEIFVEETAGGWQSPYYFSAKELDEETGLYYYGARWLSVDPMLEKYVGISPYNYCAGNPVKLVDPDGRNWVMRDVDGATEVYYDRNVTSQKDLSNDKYGAVMLEDGASLVGYTFYNDHQDNKNGKVFNASGVQINQKKPIRTSDGSHYVDIFCGVADDCVDATTLHNNYFGTSYTGPDNPKCYNAKYDNFDYKPLNWSENWSIYHDIAYSNIGASGIDGALYDPRVLGADFAFAQENLITVIFNYKVSDRFRSLGASALFTAIGFHKINVNISNAIKDGVKSIFDGVKDFHDGIYDFTKTINTPCWP
ncbi:MAG: RHS repeat-associated core domain-containing protein [Paludibacteraceae bacterium]|nr:RHS repeat-associated core domain-containing protein [Paludibacteraceae bacterium]